MNPLKPHAADSPAGAGGSSRFVLLPGAAERLGTGARIRRYQLAAVGARSAAQRAAVQRAFAPHPRFDHLARQYD